MAEKKVFAAIEAIEVQMEATHKKRQERQEELLVEHLRARQPLLERRYELVTGISEPTEEELKEFQPRGAAAAAPPASSPSGKAGGGGGRAGVPFFWLNALCNEPNLAPHITPRDRHALEYCTDVRYERGPAGMCVELHFASPNPYFENKVLRKGIYVKRAPPKPGSSGPGDIIEAREEATIIDWKPGKCLLVAAAAPPASAAAPGKKGAAGGKKGGKQQQEAGGGKKGKKGKKGQAQQQPAARSKRHGKHSGPAPDLPDPEEEEEDEEEELEEELVEEEDAGEVPGGGKTRPCPSFFRFFLPLEGAKTGAKRKELDPTMDPDDEEEEEEDDEEGLELEEDEEDEEFDDEEGGGQGRDPRARRVAARKARDQDILDTLVKRVVPCAASLYLSGGGAAATAAALGAGGGASGRKKGGGKKAAAAAKQRSEIEGAGDDEEETEEGGFTLVSGSPAGAADIAALPLTTQKALHALVVNQLRLDKLAAELKAGEWGALVAQAEEAARLGAQRRALLVGPASATSKLSIPAFWLRVLRALDAGGSMLARRDEAALGRYLADVRLVWQDLKGAGPSREEPVRTATLELEFLPGNPYFTNPVLRKHLTFNAPGGSLTKLGVESAQSDPIDWQPGRDLTVRVEKPKPGSGGGGGRAGRTRQVPSFFHFFSNAPGALCRAFNIPGQGRAAQAEAIQAQEEFMAEVINLITYFAGRLAVETYVDVDDLGDEKEDEEEDDDEEEEEEDEEEDEDGEEEEAEPGAAAARRAARRAAARSSRRGGAGGGGAGGEDGGGPGLMSVLWRLIKGGGAGGVLLGLFLVVMVVAQVLTFMDTLEFVRSRFSWAA